MRERMLFSPSLISLKFLQRVTGRKLLKFELRFHLEKEADVLKREIRLKSPRGLFMPVDRTDMLELLTQQDKLANLAKDIAGRVYGRQLVIPAPMQQNFIAC